MDYLLSMLAPLWQGAQVTLKLFFITLALALPLGLALALARRSRWHSGSASASVMKKSLSVTCAPCHSGASIESR